MNSLFAKILLWFWCTVAITVVGSAFISALNVNQNVTDAEAPAARRMTFEMEEARAAYENGGRPALQAFMDNLQRIYGIQGILADEKGRDLLTGQDRMEIELDSQLQEIKALAGQAVLVPPNCWNKPAWMGKVTVLTVLFGKRQTGFCSQERAAPLVGRPGHIRRRDGILPLRPANLPSTIDSAGHDCVRVSRRLRGQRPD